MACEKRRPVKPRCGRMRKDIVGEVEEALVACDFSLWAEAESFSVMGVEEGEAAEEPAEGCCCKVATVVASPAL